MRRHDDRHGQTETRLDQIGMILQVGAQARLAVSVGAKQPAFAVAKVSLDEFRAGDGGIVISRFEDGRIIEDHAASDTMELIRQLGVWRSVRLVITGPRLVLLRRAST